MKRKIIICLFASLFLCSCNNGKRITIFEIGESREEVINTIVNDFTIKGKHVTKDFILDEESGNCITLYDCVYKGQPYYKVRVYYNNERIRRLELKIDKDKIDDLLEKLESETGVSPHRTNLPYILNSRIDANVFMREGDAIIVTDDDYGDGDEKYHIIVVSGEQLYELNQSMM